MIVPSDKVPPYADIDALLARYDALLFDAYGVLVSASGALPGAREVIERLHEDGREYLVVSNDSSRTVSTCAAHYASFGLEIPEARIVTSGSLIGRFFEERALRGARAAVLGPDDSVRMVRDAGATLVEVNDGFDVLVVGDESGFPFLETVDDVITQLFRAYGDGREVTLLLPNPDLLYPSGEDAFGIAAGGVALLIEAALARRFPGRALAFHRLGKPSRPIFDEAQRRLPGRSLLMLGDQIETDVRGALDAGIDVALVETGIDRWSEASAARPTWRLSSLRSAGGSEG